jgi:FtsH-binding integral membrane protein
MQPNVSHQNNSAQTNMNQQQPYPGSAANPSSAAYPGSATYPSSAAYQEKLNSQEDVETGLNNSQQIHKMMRLGFIRKVYGLLSAQLTLTVALMSLSFIEGVKNFMLTNLTPFWVALGLSLAILLPLICFKSLARTVPINYILLFAWTLCEGYMLAVCCATYDPKVVMLAGLMTAAVTISLTIYAMTTKVDFTFLGGLLFCCATIMFFWSIFSIIYGFVLNSLYCVLGIIVYSIYLIFDTQLIMGKFGIEFSIDDYVYAALTIYLDIIQLFLYILQLFGRK